MTLLKKRLSQDIAAASPPQAKKFKANALYYAELMMHVRRQREQQQQRQPSLLPPPGLPLGFARRASRPASPPPQLPLPRVQVQAGVVTPILPSPREVLSRQLQPSSIPSPTSLPPPPFERARAPPSQRSPRSRNPLEMLSDVSSRVAAAPQERPRAPGKSKIDGDSYIGDRNDAGQRHGRGIMKYSNGCRYVGRFSHDKRHGFGKVWYPDGLGVYAGFWAANKRHGTGTMRFANGDVYEGEWVDDAPNGTGLLAMTNGETYDGQFVGRKKHGRGTYRWPDGTMYEGTWAGDVLHGPGILKRAGGGFERRAYLEGALVAAEAAGTQGLC